MKRKPKNPAELLIFGNPSSALKQSKSLGRHAGAAKKRGDDAKANKLIAHQSKFVTAQPQETRRSLVEAFNAAYHRAANPKSFGNHKEGCKCAFCERARDISKKDAKMPKAMRGVMSPPRNPAKGTKFNVHGKRYRAHTEAEAKKRALRDRHLRGRRAAKKTFGKNPKCKNPRRGKYQNPRRRNASDTEEAVKLFESFHGKDPKGIVEKQVSAAIRLDYTALGDLEKLIVTTPIGDKVDINFEGDGVKLASSPDGKQLYCIGGNQNIGKCLDAASLDKDFINVGEVLQVEYLARKIHGNYEPVTYYHKMGEKTGDRPILMFDKLRKQIFFIGGAYFIKKEGGVSPGIEN